MNADDIQTVLTEAQIEEIRNWYLNTNEAGVRDALRKIERATIAALSKPKCEKCGASVCAIHGIEGAVMCNLCDHIQDDAPPDYEAMKARMRESLKVESELRSKVGALEAEIERFVLSNKSLRAERGRLAAEVERLNAAQTRTTPTKKSTTLQILGRDYTYEGCLKRHAEQPAQPQDLEDQAASLIHMIQHGATQADVEAWLLFRPAAQASLAVPEGLREIGRLLRTQDNRITDQPLFIVQQRRRIYGIDPDYNYTDSIVWVAPEDDYVEASDEEAERLEAEFKETLEEPKGWQRLGYHDQWEFVTACFTEQGCKDYLAIDGHNLKEPRIFAEGSFRNNEYRLVRDWLMSLAAAPSAPQKESGK